MNSSSFFSRLFLASLLCLALSAQAPAAESTADKPAAAPATGKAAPVVKPAPATAPAPKKSAASKTEKTSAPADKKPASQAKSTPAPAKKEPAAAKKPAAPANSPEALQKGLDDFAKNTIATLNRVVIPSAGKKEITKNADGSFTARYIAIDPNSIRTSYKTPDQPGPVSYIGYMSYSENEYHCTAPTKAAADKGPFAVKSSKMLTELVKHLNGKWTY
jgi:hypothetical protein